MKLFIREHVPLTVLYIAQLGLVLLVIWLNGFQDLYSLGYAVMLSICVLIVYYLYRYVTHRSFYIRLKTPFTSLDEAFQEQAKTPLNESLNDLLRSQYQIYQQELREYESLIQNRITFINQWVHQMKTPLSVIHLTIEHEDDPVFDSIREELDRLSAGLETVLYSSRLDRFEQDFVVEPISLHQLAHQQIAEQKRLFIRNRIYPELDIDPHWVVYSDEKWLSFAFNQLLTNAVRYSAIPRIAGQAEIISEESLKKVRIVAFSRGPQVVLQVEDQGVGIPLQDQKRVFDAYFTGENGRHFQESTGMGLYLVREICTRLGHRVELESEVGAGTKVRIIFHRMG